MTTWHRYKHWLIFVLLFSAAPILINNCLDYLTDKSQGSFFQGIRLNDYLICAFCIIGGALCERYNSMYHPSAGTVVFGIAFAASLLAMYLEIKYSLFKPLAVEGRYPTDSAWIWSIVAGYVLAVVFSLVLMRKAYVVTKVK